MKKIIFAVSLFFAVCVAAFTDIAREGEFEFDTASALITGYSGAGGDVSLRLSGIRAAAVGAGAFRGKNISGVDLPPELTLIGWGAFQGNSITRLALPESLTRIEAAAFQHNKLEELLLPAAALWIGERAFAGNAITRIRIGADVVLGAGVFEYGFAEYYTNTVKRRPGTYVYRNNTWYTEAGWRALNMDDGTAVEFAARERAEAAGGDSFAPETVSVKDFQVRGPVIITRQEIFEGGPLGLWSSNSGETITAAALMTEAARLGADEVINVRVERQRTESSSSLFGYRIVYTHTATALAVKYTDAVTQVKSQNHRELEKPVLPPVRHTRP